MCVRSCAELRLPVDVPVAKPGSRLRGGRLSFLATSYASVEIYFLPWLLSTSVSIRSVFVWVALTLPSCCGTLPFVASCHDLLLHRGLSSSFSLASQVLPARKNDSRQSYVEHQRCCIRGEFAFPRLKRRRRNINHSGPSGRVSDQNSRRMAVSVEGSCILPKRFFHGEAFVFRLHARPRSQSALNPPPRLPTRGFTSNVVAPEPDGSCISTIKQRKHLAAASFMCQNDCSRRPSFQRKDHTPTIVYGLPSTKKPTLSTSSARENQCSSPVPLSLQHPTNPFHSVPRLSASRSSDVGLLKMAGCTSHQGETADDRHDNKASRQRVESANQGRLSRRVEKPVVFILGPTGVGKTKLAVDLCVSLRDRYGINAEIINADSMQVYRGCDVGTAKATAEEQRLVTHHLLDICDATAEDFSVVKYLGLALETIERLHRAGMVPVVVGGTQLYIQHLLWPSALDSYLDESIERGKKEASSRSCSVSSSGAAEVPSPTAATTLKSCLSHTSEIKKQPLPTGKDGQLSKDLVTEDLEALPSEVLYARLTTVDPERAVELHPRDRRRIIRSLQTFAECGERQSSLIRRYRDESVRRGLRYPTCILWVDCRDETEHTQRLRDRAHTMVQCLWDSMCQCSSQCDLLQHTRSSLRRCFSDFCFCVKNGLLHECEFLLDSLHLDEPSVSSPSVNRPNNSINITTATGTPERGALTAAGAPPARVTAVWPTSDSTRPLIMATIDTLEGCAGPGFPGGARYAGTAGRAGPAAAAAGASAPPAAAAGASAPPAAAAGSAEPAAAGSAGGAAAGVDVPSGGGAFGAAAVDGAGSGGSGNRTSDERSGCIAGRCVGGPHRRKPSVLESIGYREYLALVLHARRLGVPISIPPAEDAFSPSAAMTTHTSSAGAAGGNARAYQDRVHSLLADTARTAAVVATGAAAPTGATKTAEYKTPVRTAAAAFSTTTMTKQGEDVEASRRGDLETSSIPSGSPYVKRAEDGGKGIAADACTCSSVVGTTPCRPCLNVAMESLVTRTRHYARKQRRWIVNKFLLRQQHLPIYLFDTSGAAASPHWETRIREPALQIVYDFCFSLPFDEGHPLAAARHLSPADKARRQFYWQQQQQQQQEGQHRVTENEQQQQDNQKQHVQEVEKGLHHREEAQAQQQHHTHFNPLSDTDAADLTSGDDVRRTCTPPAATGVYSASLGRGIDPWVDAGLNRARECSICQHICHGLSEWKDHLQSKMHKARVLKKMSSPKENKGKVFQRANEDWEVINHNSRRTQV